MALKFSVVIPTYNRGYCIKNSIESSLQFLEDGEIIVVDDGSTDGTKEILRPYIDSQKIIYMDTGSNLGANAAKNCGARAAKGEWIVFQDSDDTFTSDAFLRIKKYIDIQADKGGLIFFSCLNEQGVPMSSNPSFEGFVNFKEYIKGSKTKGEYLPVVKREVFIKTPFYEDISGGEGIVWGSIIKEQKAFFCSDVVRIYNDTGTDRLSYKKHNLNRLYLVFKKDISIFYKEYLMNSPSVLIGKLARVCYYFVASKMQKTDGKNG